MTETFEFTYWVKSDDGRTVWTKNTHLMTPEDISVRTVIPPRQVQEGYVLELHYDNWFIARYTFTAKDTNRSEILVNTTPDGCIKLHSSRSSPYFAIVLWWSVIDNAGNVAKWCSAYRAFCAFHRNNTNPTNLKIEEKEEDLVDEQEIKRFVHLMKNSDYLAHSSEPAIFTVCSLSKGDRLWLKDVPGAEFVCSQQGVYVLRWGLDQIKAHILYETPRDAWYSSKDRSELDTLKEKHAFEVALSRSWKQGYKLVLQERQKTLKALQASELRVQDLEEELDQLRPKITIENCHFDYSGAGPNSFLERREHPGINVQMPDSAKPDYGITKQEKAIIEDMYGEGYVGHLRAQGDPIRTDRTMPAFNSAKEKKAEPVTLAIKDPAKPEDTGKPSDAGYLFAYDIEADNWVPTTMGAPTKPEPPESELIAEGKTTARGNRRGLRDRLLDGLCRLFNNTGETRFRGVGIPQVGDEINCLRDDGVTYVVNNLTRTWYGRRKGVSASKMRHGRVMMREDYTFPEWASKVRASATGPVA